MSFYLHMLQGLKCAKKHQDLVFKEDLLCFFLATHIIRLHETSSVGFTVQYHPYLCYTWTWCRSYVSPVPLSYESFVPCKVILFIACTNLNNRNDPNSCRDSHISIQGLEKTQFQNT